LVEGHQHPPSARSEETGAKKPQTKQPPIKKSRALEGAGCRAGPRRGEKNRAPSRGAPAIEEKTAKKRSREDEKRAPRALGVVGAGKGGRKTTPKTKKKAERPPRTKTLTKQRRKNEKKGRGIARKETETEGKRG